METQRRGITDRPYSAVADFHSRAAVLRAFHHGPIAAAVVQRCSAFVISLSTLCPVKRRVVAGTAVLSVRIRTADASFHAGSGLVRRISCVCHPVHAVRNLFTETSGRHRPGQRLTATGCSSGSKSPRTKHERAKIEKHRTGFWKMVRAGHGGFHHATGRNE